MSTYKMKKKTTYQNKIEKLSTLDLLSVYTADIMSERVVIDGSVSEERIKISYEVLKNRILNLELTKKLYELSKQK